MKGPDHSAVDESRNKLLHPAAHFIPSLGRESEGEDPKVSMTSAVQNARNACCKHGRLAHARAGKHKASSLAPLCSLPLCGAQAFHRACKVGSHAVLLRSLVIRWTNAAGICEARTGSE